MATDIGHFASVDQLAVKRRLMGSEADEQKKHSPLSSARGTIVSMESGANNSEPFRDVRHYMEALKDPDASVRSRAADALGKIGDLTAVPALIEAVKDSEYAVRGYACIALSLFGTAVIPALVEALKDTKLDVRQGAATALRELGEIAEPAVPAMIEALQDHDAGVRTSVACALSALGAVSAIPALIAAMQNADDEDGEAIAYALIDFDEAAVPDLIEALKKDEIQGQALWVLGQIRDERAVPALIELLTDTSPTSRREAAITLGEIGDPSAVPALIEALRDQDADVRQKVGEALGTLEDARAVPALLGALRNGESMAGWALAVIGDASAVPELIEIFNRSDNEAQRGAALALAGIRDARSVRVLVEALHQNDQDAHQAALSALKWLRNDWVVSALIEAFKDNPDRVRLLIAHTLRQFEDPRIVPMTVLENNVLTPAEKRKALETLRASDNSFNDATKYLLPTVGEYCQSLLERGDVTDRIRGGARAVLTVINREQSASRTRP